MESGLHTQKEKDKRMLFWVMVELRLSVRGEETKRDLTNSARLLESLVDTGLVVGGSSHVLKPDSLSSAVIKAENG